MKRAGAIELAIHYAEPIKTHSSTRFHCQEGRMIMSMYTSKNSRVSKFRRILHHVSM